ncbi:MAG: transcriptional regulator [Bacteroidales bacterium]|nr:transcriptional regulator [Bacteroidales bacterium]
MTELDSLLHSQLRLAIMSILISVEEADFVYLKQKTEATAGNLSIQLDKLENAGYISTNKVQENNRPRTICKITETGRIAMNNYVEALRSYLSNL